MAFLDWNVENPTQKTEAERMLDGIEGGTQRSATNLDPQKLKRLRAMLGWACSENLSRELSLLPVTEAVHRVQIGSGVLRGHRAYRWLRSMGFQVAVPDRGRRRLLHRLGWTFQPEGTVGAVDEAFRAMQNIGTDAGITLPEIDIVLGHFSGSSGAGSGAAAVCLPEPACERCPVAPQCAYAIDATGVSSVATARNDSAAVRLRRGETALLSDEDLLDLLLAPARRVQAESSARASALKSLGGPGGLTGDMRFGELKELAGIGSDGALVLLALSELHRRMSAAVEPEMGASLLQPSRVFEEHRTFFAALKQEEVHVICVDIKHRPLRRDMVSRGSLVDSMANPREVFREAIRVAAYGILVVHNHPSGDPSPSPEDLKATGRLGRAGQLLGIPLLDHVIIGRDRYFSFQESGLLGLLLGEDEPEDT